MSEAHLGVAADINSHPVCQTCRGICCARFQIVVGLGNDGYPNWDRLKQVYQAPDREVEFIKQHFAPIRQPGDACDRVGLGSDGAPLRAIWFTCKAFVNGRCSKYDERPQVCRTHLCDPAEKLGLNPELVIERRSDGNGYEYAYLWPGLYDLNRGEPPDMGFVPNPPLDYGVYAKESKALRDAIDAELETRVVAAMARAGIAGGIKDLVALIETRTAERHTKQWGPIVIEAAAAKAEDTAQTVNPEVRA